MSILGMETERARQAARQMDQTRQTAEEEALRRALDRLFSAWQGGAAADFLAQAGHLSSRLERAPGRPGGTGLPHGARGGGMRGIGPAKPGLRRPQQPPGTGPLRWRTWLQGRVIPQGYI